VLTGSYQPELPAPITPSLGGRTGILHLLHKSGSRMLGMEIKAAETWHPGFKTALNRFSEKTSPLQGKYIAYRGRPLHFEDGVKAVPYDVAGSLPS
jgi:hypothetical protein